MKEINNIDDLRNLLRQKWFFHSSGVDLWETLTLQNLMINT